MEKFKNNFAVFFSVLWLKGFFPFAAGTVSFLSEVVIDEFSGQLITTSFASTSLLLNILAFLFFRVFDILKPWFIENLENIEGVLGVMLDDWLAGLISSAIILFIPLLIKYNILGY